jgi:DNA-binding beta-propeller fold protein YncE
MGVGKFLVVGIVVAGVGATAMTLQARRSDKERIVTGKFVSPQGTQTAVGSFPINMATSPDGRYFAVTNVGFRQQLSIIDSATGNLVSRLEFPATAKQDRGLYYGLAFVKQGEQTLLYASEGAEDAIGVFELSTDGRLSKLRRIENPGPPNKRKIPHHVAGIALSGDGRTLYAVNNQSHEENGFTGSVSFIDAASGQVGKKVTVPAFPFAVVAPAQGPQAGRKIYVSCERDGYVAAIDVASGDVKNIRVGGGPTSLLLSRDGTKLYVTNSLSDTLVTLDLRSDRVADTLLLRQGDLRGLPGVTPLGMALGPDEDTLYVALADMNAVAVVDTGDHKIRGLVDVGWYPTSVSLSPDGRHLFVANAKGVQTRNPNNKPVGAWGTYAPNIIEGTVSALDLSEVERQLSKSTDRVLSNNLASNRAAAAISNDFHRPPVRHVVYVIKENRTYDQVLGDLPQGNGDPSLCLFPREVTPNQHALAERFALLDNFYVCAEVSFDGWAWSTQGMTNAYLARNVPYNYSGRGRAYDSEGTNNGSAVDLKGMKDVAESGGGYFWEHAHKGGVSYRNYGFFVDTVPARKGADGKAEEAEHVEGLRRSLLDTTCKEFKDYDLAYPDSDAALKHGVPPAPKQLLAFGRYRARNRISAFRREFESYVRKGELPGLMTVRLPRNHTSGTADGMSSARAMVADNDYAVGELVEMISHSPFWKDTVICVLEDDAQAGTDHVDCHRSPALVISPYVERSKIDSRFYNTDSMLRTMGLLLKLKPMNTYDAIASPIDVFTEKPANLEPYSAILPSKHIVGEVNSRRAYRSTDSTRLISRFGEDSASDVELNDILWGSIKGPRVPRPQLRGARWRVEDLD